MNKELHIDICPSRLPNNRNRHRQPQPALPASDFTEGKKPSLF